MPQYLRYCSVTVDGAGGSMDLSQLRCRFKITPIPLIVPTIGYLRVTNLGVQKAQAIVHSEFKTLTIDAGYEDGHGVIFKGNIIQGIYGRENPTDTLLSVYANDGDQAHNWATVNTTHPPGSTPQDHFNTALQAMGQYGVTKGYIGIDLSTPKYPRAVTLWGMARDVLAGIAKAKDAMLFYDQQQVTMIPRTGSRPGGAIVLNSTTGLIGMPTQTTDGIFARCLINPAIRRGSQVQINEKDINKGAAEIDQTGQNAIGLQNLAAVAADGLYTVIKIETFGDTRGNDWYMDLGMWATNSPQPPTSDLRNYNLAPAG